MGILAPMPEPSEFGTTPSLSDSEGELLTHILHFPMLGYICAKAGKMTFEIVDGLLEPMQPSTIKTCAKKFIVQCLPWNKISQRYCISNATSLYLAFHFVSCISRPHSLPIAKRSCTKVAHTFRVLTPPPPPLIPQDHRSHYTHACNAANERQICQVTLFSNVTHFFCNIHQQC